MLTTMRICVWELRTHQVNIRLQREHYCSQLLLNSCLCVEHTCYFLGYYNKLLFRLIVSLGKWIQFLEHCSPQLENIMCSLLVNWINALLFRIVKNFKVLIQRHTVQRIYF